MICRTPMSGNRIPFMFGMGTHQTMEPTNETHAFCGKYSKGPSPTRPFPCSEDGDAADEAELQDRALPDLPRRVAGVSHILLALLCRMRLALLWALLWAILRARLWALLWALLWARLWALLCALGVALCISGRTCRHVEALPFCRLNWMPLAHGALLFFAFCGGAEGGALKKTKRGRLPNMCPCLSWPL